MTRVLQTVELMEEVDACIAEFFNTLPYLPAYVIAGGALRDTLLGQPVKDIDVVVASKNPWKVDWPSEEYGPTGGFSATHASFDVRGLPVNLIYRGGDISIQSMMEYHSMGVSNVFWSAGALVFDPVFFRDVRDKTHTVNRSRWGGVGPDVDEERLQKYIDKITQKYPWPLRDKS